MLVGAARALCARRESLPGTVVFMFQPGEEGYHGARFMLEDGLLDDILPGRRPDAAFALHIWPTVERGKVVGRAGPLLASADTLTATIIGRGGHAAMPHDSLDPIPVACEIVMALQTFIARTVPVTDPAVLSITKINAGTAHNIVPSSAELLGTLRTLSETTRTAVQAGFKRIVEHVAAAHGLQGEARIDGGYPVTLNDGRAVDLVRRCAASVGSDQDWVELPAPIMGAEDFSYVLREIPGAGDQSPAPQHAHDPRRGDDGKRGRPPLHLRRTVFDEWVRLIVSLPCTLSYAPLHYLRNSTRKHRILVLGFDKIVCGRHSNDGDQVPCHFCRLRSSCTALRCGRRFSSLPCRQASRRHVCRRDPKAGCGQEQTQFFGCSVWFGD
jgi:hippurate hydrolase